jgi:superfamily II DNA or RNA helicase
MAGYYILDVPKLAKERLHNAKQPFPHQQGAFSALSKALPLPLKGYVGTLLVLPTGGGKTFASVNWICRNILPNGAKALWLAQSAYLLDQASETFRNEIHNANGRDKINLRVVSSSTEHASQGSIELTDDVLICTTQTAISAYSSEPLDGCGKVARTPFRKFIDNCKDAQLFVVIDEAHHTPAYGCRTLLLSLRDEIPNLYVLGLTATPMHMDKRISGWLKNIYDRWICYEAKKEELELNKILAVPKYIERQTGMEFEVDDGLFDRLANKHKDLPESIIELLAKNQGRNNLIVDDYSRNQAEYGKTLIFADRWFQCEHIVEKLKELGLRAAAVYSAVTGQDRTYQGGSGRRNDEMNRQAMQDFREGKYDVVVNVKMLTEGIDVPDVKTVMVTRQTTSNILLTQMIGRALRGEKAGGGEGKDYANIVFFHDTWKRLIPWAEIDGGAESARPAIRRRNPMELVSIQLVKLAAQDIPFKGFENAEYLTFIPVGFLACEYTVASDDGEEMLTFAENVVVYEFNKDKYISLLNHLEAQNLEPYSAEDVSAEKLSDYASELARSFFSTEKDGFDGLLLDNIGKIVRHMAQNNLAPEYIGFAERGQYDLDRIAGELLNTLPLDANIILKNRFNNAGLHWAFLYKTFDNFINAYYKSQKRAIDKRSGAPAPTDVPPEVSGSAEFTDELKQQVFARDNNTCLCCGKKRRKGVTLNADHILPVAMGGRNAISNMQTLCKHCNTVKGVNEIDFRTNVSPLSEPKSKLRAYETVPSDDLRNRIARVVNEFYHCAAMCILNAHTRSNGQYYKTWEIVLYKGNNADWLLKYKQKLLDYIQPGYPHVEDITIRD